MKLLRRYIICSLILHTILMVLVSCNGNVISRDHPLMVGDSIVDSLTLCNTIDSIVKADNDTTAADKAVRSLYSDRHKLCWLTPDGLTAQADSLMMYLSRVVETGFSKRLFRVSDIKADRERLDSLDFSESNMYTVITRLDYNLTKALVRYTAWQRYGFVNPYRIFNRMDTDPHDTLKNNFLTLYDTPTQILGSDGYRHLAALAGSDSVSVVLSAAEPRGKLYERLKDMLRTSHGAERKKILVNMERCRWRQYLTPDECERYVVVNIPSYELIAASPDSLLEMRIVCGSHSTKTPLLNSSLMRMDVNPRWIIPRSVIKHEIAPHAGDSAYFARHRYVICDPKTGDCYDPHHVTRQMLEEPGLRVFQKGGEGNAIGRLIFRFDNKFSIFLHDTSTRGTFARNDRRASHGCIRVEQPYRLACFLLQGKPQSLLDKLRYSMEEKSDSLDPHKVVHSLGIKPAVPLFIYYYTIYSHPDGSLRTYPDVYGYDERLLKALAPIL